ACHWIDLLQFLVGSPPTEVYARALRDGGQPVLDEVSMTLTFADGSVGTILYAAGGDRSFGKERLEILGDGRDRVLDDCRSLEMVSGGRRVHRRTRLRTDKGHRGEWEALAAAARSGGPTPIGLAEIVSTHLAAYAAIESLRLQQPVTVPPSEWQQGPG